MWLLVNYAKQKATLYWKEYILTAGNYKSASGQIENSGQLQNNYGNGAMSIAINRVILVETEKWVTKKVSRNKK